MLKKETVSKEFKVAIYLYLLNSIENSSTAEVQLVEKWRTE